MAAGERRARPRPGPRGLRRRDAVAPARSSSSPSTWWPPLDATDVLRLAARPATSWPGSARASLTRRGPAAARQVVGGDGSLSVEDVPLLDELRYSLGDVPARHEERPLAARRGAPGRRGPAGADHRRRPRVRARPVAPGRRRRTGSRTTRYAHVLVDEAQDLTPMQWRMVGRRGPAATWTIVGDPAQSSWPDPDEAAAARADALDGKDAARVPAVDQLPQLRGDLRPRRAYAARVGLDADLPTAVRRTGVEPRTVAPDVERTASVPTSPDGRSTSARGAAARRSTAPSASSSRARATRPRSRPGSPTPRRRGPDRGAQASTPRAWSSTASSWSRPHEIDAESATGRATLYVVLTRATQLRLDAPSGR